MGQGERLFVDFHALGCPQSSANRARIEHWAQDGEVENPVGLVLAASTGELFEDRSFGRPLLRRSR
jgi:hypothetical protein